ncbi:MAG: type I secretion system permease/ATPase [Chromatiaceae bacterium]|nr:type I secretion system permease/ATPase [Chromatiaceae bacterium]
MFNRPRRPPDELREVLATSRGSFIFAGIFSLFINLLMLLPALYMLQLYDRVLSSRSESTLLALTLLVVALYAVLGLLEMVRSHLLVRISAKLDMSLNTRLFNAMFDAGLRQGRGNGAQPLQDLTSLRQFLTGNGLFAFFDAPWIPLYVAVIFLLHPLLGWLAIAGVVIIASLAVVNELITRKPLNEANRISIVSNQIVAGNLRNAEALEAMGMLGNVQKRWFARQAQVLNLQALASERGGRVTSASKALRITLQSLMLGLGAYLAIEQVVTPGAMIAGSILLGRAMAPVDMLIGTWKQFLNARSAYARLRDLLQRVPERQWHMSLPAPTGQIRAEQVVVIPPGSQQPVLRGINFEITPGEAIAIIGPSAAGKSSLARTVLGIWPTAAGKIRLDGAAIEHWNREDLGPHIGYLPQDVELLEGTIKDNIARFGQAESEVVVRAAQRAGVHEMILQLPNGYDTPIGERGVVLSSGQRQRIGLARAIYGDPRIVVLDEPNSNLDEVGEAALAQALTHLKQAGATVLVITHRPSLLGSVDRIMVVKDGSLQLFGPREQVLAQLKRPARPAQALPRTSSPATATS